MQFHGYIRQTWFKVNIALERERAKAHEIMSVLHIYRSAILEREQVIKSRRAVTMRGIAMRFEEFMFSTGSAGI